MGYHGPCHGGIGRRIVLGLALGVLIPDGLVNLPKFLPGLWTVSLTDLLPNMQLRAISAATLAG